LSREFVYFLRRYSLLCLGVLRFAFGIGERCFCSGHTLAADVTVVGGLEHSVSDGLRAVILPTGSPLFFHDFMPDCRTVADESLNIQS
jgi:hypothetical protein